MKNINREYLESLSTENAACVMREKCKQNSSDEQVCSITINVKCSIDYALRNLENTKLVY